MKDRPLKSLGLAAGFAAAATALAAAGNAAISRRVSPLPPAIEGEQKEYDWDGGRIAYTCAGDGLPVLMLHSHNAAASSYEVREAFGLLASGYRVYAPDLPGYGRSERRRKEYFDGTYVRFLHDFARDVIREPAIVIAASVSGSHAILAVAEDADAFTHLVLASPTGLCEESVSSPPLMQRLSALQAVPVWGQSAFNALVSKRSIRWHYEHLIYHDPRAVTQEMVEYAWASAHQPNALYAPASFLAGKLWADARAAYESVRLPILIVWGADDHLNPYARVADFLESNASARTLIVPECGGAPYDEKAHEFAQAVIGFLGESGAPPRL